MTKGKELFDRIKEYTDAEMDQTEIETKLWDEFGATRACLVLDSTGFTRVTKAKGITYFLTLITRMRVIAADVMSRNNGLNLRFEADNVYNEFASIDEALKVAFEMHAAIANAKLSLVEDEYFRVCIGIGFGELMLGGHEGVYGDEMNIASKLGEDTAEGGETLLSEAAFKALSNHNFKYEMRNIIISGVALNYYACKQ